VGGIQVGWSPWLGGQTNRLTCTWKIYTLHVSFSYSDPRFYHHSYTLWTVNFSTLEVIQLEKYASNDFEHPCSCFCVQLYFWCRRDKTERFPTVHWLVSPGLAGLSPISSAGTVRLTFLIGEIYFPDRTQTPRPIEFWTRVRTWCLDTPGWFCNCLIFLLVPSLGIWCESMTIRAFWRNCSWLIIMVFGLLLAWVSTMHPWVSWVWVLCPRCTQLNS
jgi:hypothetical protein